MKPRIRIANIYIAALLLILTASSCKKDFLDREPYGGLPTGDAIKTADDMETALSGVYSAIRNPTMFGRSVPLIGDLLADNVYISSDLNSNRYLEFMQINYTVNNGNSRDLWQTAYNAIMNANNIIQATLTATPQINQMKGEALALRGLMYFELIKHFSRPYTVAGPNALGVPLVLTYDPFKKPARNTIGEVYTQIEKDFRDAMALLTIDRPSGYINHWAAEALLARMHQFKGEWAKALTAAEDVIDNSPYMLLSYSQFTSYWGSNTPRFDGVETLFEVVNDLVGNGGIDALSYFYDQNGYGDALATEALFNTYSSSDIRSSLILDFSPTRGPVRVVNKYPNSTQPDKDEVKIIRMSEVFLIAAEAARNLNNDALAQDYVNAVAFERDPFFAGYSTTGAALLADIMLERRKELAFEGHRYWDLARYNQNVARVNLDNNYASGIPLTILATNFRRILPIPQIELDANPNIRTQQNPGY